MKYKQINCTHNPYSNVLKNIGITNIYSGQCFGCKLDKSLLLTYFVTLCYKKATLTFV